MVDNVIRYRGSRKRGNFAVAIASDINFAPGVTVNIAMTSGEVFTGELVQQTDDYLQIRLTVGTGPYVAGQVVELNTAEIVSVG